MKDKLETWALIIGLGLAGPAYLACFVVFTIRGELPGRHGNILTADVPYLFYPVMLALIALGLKATQWSFLFVRYSLRGRSERDQSQIG